MSQSIRSCSGFGPILQHIPNNTSSSSSSSSSCMFLTSTEHTEVSFPINLSIKQRRKKAAWISNSNPRLPCATMTSNVDVDEAEDGTSSSKGSKYDHPLKVLWLGVSQVWRKILSNMTSGLRYGVSKGVIVMTIRMDRHDPIDGLKILLDVSRSWRRILCTAGKELYDAKDFEDNYGKSYLLKARMEGGTNKDKHHKVKNSPSMFTTRLWIFRILADLEDPNDGLEILLGALELWRTKFSSNELNDSEGYLQKEIFAIRDLSHRISVFNRNGKHDGEKKSPSRVTYFLALFKLMIDHFEDPEDAIKARKEACRCFIEGIECDGAPGFLFDAVANVLRS